jgi:hypothetical protein
MTPFAVIVCTPGPEDRADSGIQIPGVARLSALEMDQVGMDRREHRRLPLAGVKAPLSQRNAVPLGTKLGDPEQRSQICQSSNLNSLGGAELLDRGRERSEVPPWVGNSTTRRKPPRANSWAIWCVR